ncbi:phage antirepressor KilAC domain-containing protein [Pseudomonas sp. LB3P58]
MERTLAQAATLLGLTRQELIAFMQEKGLLNERRLPVYPTRDREYLRVKDGQWFHEKYGLQYSQPTKVKLAGIRWLADQLGIDRPAIAADRRDVA